MTISTAQYNAMRGALRGGLSSNDPGAANPSESEVLGFFAQLFAASSGSSVLGSRQQAAMDEAMRTVLTSNALAGNPSALQVTDFVTQLAADSSGASPLVARRYSVILSALRDSLSVNYPGTINPSEADVLSYFGAYQTLIQSFSAAEITGFSNTAGANKFTCVDGVGGAPPQFTTGKTVIFLIKNVSGAATQVAQFGSLAGNRGWAVGSSASQTPYVQFYNNAVTTIGASLTSKLNFTVCTAITLTSGGVFRVSTNGSTVESAAAPTYVPANAGDTFTMGTSEIVGQAAPASFFGFAILNRELNDTELVAFSSIAHADNRYDMSSILADSACQVYWTALEDWNGVASTSTTRGSSPLVLAKNGAPVRTAFTEIRQALSSTQVQDSAGENVVGSGTNIKKMHAEYAISGLVAGSTELTVDLVGDGTQFSAAEISINGGAATVLTSGYVNSNNTRKIYRQSVTVSQLIEWIDSVQVASGGLNSVGAVLQAFRYRASAPWTLNAYTPPTRRLVIVGDSIPSGVGATVAANGWGRIIRGNYPGRVTFLAYGSAKLADYYADIPGLAQKAVTAVQQGGGVTTREIWLELGVNDGTSDTAFKAAYALFLDTVHALDPSVHIYVQTCGITSGELASVIQMRVDQAAIGNARSSWCSVTDGTSLYTSGQLFDSVHPNNTGHAACATNVRAVLGY